MSQPITDDWDYRDALADCDGPKAGTWDVRNGDLSPVTTLAAMCHITGASDYGDAARSFLTTQAAKAAPLELRLEARAVAKKTGPQPIPNPNWPCWNSDGTPVTTLAGLAVHFGKPVADAAASVLRMRPAVDVPAAILAEARALAPVTLPTPLAPGTPNPNSIRVPPRSQSSSSHKDRREGLVEVKSVWTGDLHPRDKDGRFINLGDIVSAGKTTGTVVGVGKGGALSVRDADGKESEVQADAATVAKKAPAAAAAAAKEPAKAGKKLRADGKEYATGYSATDPRGTITDYDEYVEKLDRGIATAEATHGNTLKLFSGPDGQLTPARQKVDDAILAELLTRYKDVPREHKWIILAGPFGAGKTTTMNALGHQFGVKLKTGADGKPTPENFATVSPDDIKELLLKHGGMPPEYAKLGIGPEEAATLFHAESMQISSLLDTQLQKLGMNVLVDGSMGGSPQRSIDWIEQIKASGYTVAGVLIDGDIPTSFAQAGTRHMNGATEVPTKGNLTGRYVPYSIIEAQKPSGRNSDVFGRQYKSGTAENFEQAMAHFNGGSLIYDNSTRPAKVVHARSGPLIESGIVAIPPATKAWYAAIADGVVTKQRY